jgi:hypothetical protein
MEQITAADVKNLLARHPLAPIKVAQSLNPIAFDMGTVILVKGDAKPVILRYGVSPAGSFVAHWSRKPLGAEQVIGNKDSVYKHDLLAE